MDCRSKKVSVVRLDWAAARSGHLAVALAPGVRSRWNNGEAGRRSGPSFDLLSASHHLCPASLRIRQEEHVLLVQDARAVVQARDALCTAVCTVGAAKKVTSAAVLSA